MNPTAPRPPQAWLRALLTPSTHLTVERFGRTHVGADWALERRTVREHYLTFFLRGSAHVTVPGFSGGVAPMTTILLAPGTPHDFRPLGEERFVFYHWRFTLSQTRAGRTMPLVHTPESWVRPEMDHLLPLFEAAHDAWLSQRAFDDARLRGLLTAIAGTLFQSEHPEATGGLSYAQRRAVFQYANRRITSGDCQISPADLARVAALSPDYFSRVFKQSFGVSPKRWILRERIRSAAFLLGDTAASVSDIAEATGFSSVYAFSKQFRTITGTSPTHYRKRR